MPSSLLYLSRRFSCDQRQASADAANGAERAEAERRRQLAELEARLRSEYEQQAKAQADRHIADLKQRDANGSTSDDSNVVDLGRFAA